MARSELDRLSKHQRGLIERLQEEAPVKLSQMAEELGVRVISSTLAPGISGELRQDEDGQFFIKVNRHDSRSRQRFTVAHELAHYLLHREAIGSGISEDVLYRSGLSDAREAEANKLAAHILMPIGLVRSKLEELGGVPTEEIASLLAEQFGVSEAAMRIRLGLQ